MRPPGLAWLDSFSISIGLALDQKLMVRVYSTVNPLVYTVQIDLADPIKPENGVLVWNLFQKWASANDCMPNARVKLREVAHPISRENFNWGFSTEVQLRERLGHPKDEHP
jgi:hypothetical protein